MSERVNEENYQKLCELYALCGDEVSTVNTVRKIRLFMQNEPNLYLGKNNVSSLMTSAYENFLVPAAGKNEPKRTQFADLQPEIRNTKLEMLNTKFKMRIAYMLAHGIAMGY